MTQDFDNPHSFDLHRRERTITGRLGSSFALSRCHLERRLGRRPPIWGHHRRPHRYVCHTLKLYIVLLPTRTITTKNRSDERNGTRTFVCGHIDLPLAPRARDERARRARTVIWRVDRRICDSNQCTVDCSWGFCRRRASHGHVPHHSLFRLARWPADIWRYQSRYRWVLGRWDLCRSVFCSLLLVSNPE